MWSRFERFAIACLVLAVWAGAQHLLFTVGMPAGLPESVVGRMLGMLDAATLLVLHHYFSSTARSQSKDDTIRALSLEGKPHDPKKQEE
jgi:hypothetical protein